MSGKNLVTLEGEPNLIRKKVIKYDFNQCLVIKDGVDILTMNAEREPIDTESTLELILNTLCRAFVMKPK